VSASFLVRLLFKNRIIDPNTHNAKSKAGDLTMPPIIKTNNTHRLIMLSNNTKNLQNILL